MNLTPITSIISAKPPSPLRSDTIFFHHGGMEEMEVHGGRFAPYRYTEITEDHGVHGGRFALYRYTEVTE